MKNYELKATASKELFRVVDRDGNWTHYFHKPSKRYLRAVNYILDSGYAKGPGFYQYLKNKSAEEADRILKIAGDRGDRIHRAVSLLLQEMKIHRGTRIYDDEKGEEAPLQNSDWDAILAFAEFWNRHNPILYENEYPTFNLVAGYAGTMDLIVSLTKDCGVKTCKCKELIGKVGVLDVKSGGGIYNSFGAQIAAYAKGENLPVKPDYTGIIRVGTNHKTTGGYQFEPYSAEETTIHYAEFLAAMAISNSEYKPFNPDEDIYDIPDSVKVSVKRFEIKKVKVAKAKIKKAKEKLIKKSKIKK